MGELLLDARQIYSMSDFIRNHKAHVARLKITRAPEVLTVNGRAEVVVLDAETYQDLMERVRHMQAVAEVRQIISHDKKPDDPIAPEELGRRTRVMEELVAETERLGLY